MHWGGACSGCSYVALQVRTARYEYVGIRVGIAAIRDAVGACRGRGAGFSATCFLGVYLFAAAIATTGSEIKGRVVAVAEEVNGGGFRYDHAANLSGEVRHLFPDLGVVFPELVNNPGCLVCLDVGQCYHFGDPNGFHLLGQRVV